MNRSLFQNWKHSNNDFNTLKKIKLLNLNFGPQHPAAHGVLRLIAQLNGEVIEKLDSHVGLLHRGSEKLIESKNFLQSIPYFDRFDYVSMLVQEHAYCLAIESLAGTLNNTASYTQIRVIFDELTRILNHMLAIACHALDVGSMSSIFWAFEEREKIMEFYERVSGARMHAAFYRPNELNCNAISNTLLNDILIFSKNCFSSLNEMHNVLTFNKIWKQRLINIGAISYKQCYDYGLTGVIARSTGIQKDIRISKFETYSNYYYLNFRVFTGKNGDCYDRFLIRMNEMSESLNLITQSIFKLFILKKKNISSLNILAYLNNAATLKININFEYTAMEKLIEHFKYWSEGFILKSGISQKSIESPKGEFCVTLIANSTNKPFKCKIRSPAYHHLQALPIFATGHFLADLATIIGTIDIVFGEIDR